MGLGICLQDRKSSCTPFDFVHHEGNGWCITSSRPVNYEFVVEGDILDEVLPGLLGYYIYPRDSVISWSDRSSPFTADDLTELFRKERESRTLSAVPSRLNQVLFSTQSNPSAFDDTLSPCFDYYNTCEDESCVDDDLHDEEEGEEEEGEGGEEEEEEEEEGDEEAAEVGGDEKGEEEDEPSLEPISASK